MTEFKFVFEKKKSGEGEQGTVGGTYNFFTDEIKIYLTNIANIFFAWVPGAMCFFKDSFISELETKMEEQVYESINHEYLHKSLGRTECPLNKQHYGIDHIK